MKCNHRFLRGKSLLTSFMVNENCTSPADTQSYSRCTWQQGVQSDIPEMKWGYDFKRQSEMETAFSRRQKTWVLFPAQLLCLSESLKLSGPYFFLYNTGIAAMHWCGSWVRNFTELVINCKTKVCTNKPHTGNQKPWILVPVLPLTLWFLGRFTCEMKVLH